MEFGRALRSALEADEVDVQVSPLRSALEADEVDVQVSQCPTVAVRLDSGLEVRVNARDSCPYRAVDVAVDRLKRSVTDRMKRRRDRRRRSAA
jgi:ribosome-associated translation inhibitor RaiA